jgi:hypothetical protein
MYYSKPNHISSKTITTTIALWLILCALASFAYAAADSPHLGTWKLNEAKSKLAPAAGKNNTVVYAAAGDQVKVTVDGTDEAGKATHNTWKGKFDGKDYAVKGDATSDTRAYSMVNDRALAMTVKKGGKVTTTGRVEVAKDGKTRTVTINGKDAKGKKFKSKAVYDKQ